MEENRVEEDAIQSLKVGLMGPLAGVGDTLVFTIYISILFSIGASLASQGSILGPILVIPLTFVPLFLCRYFGTIVAYRKGMESIDQITSALGKVTTIAQKIGLIVIGAMSVLLVSAKTPISIAVGDATIAVQDKLDMLLPGLLPLCFVFACYQLLVRAKWSPVKVLLLLMVVGFVLGAIGAL